MRIRGLGRVKQLGKKVRNRLSPGALILLYHRIAELPTDPQLLSVSPKNFAEQLSVIKQLGVPVSLGSLSGELSRRKVTPKSIVITFDDGAADNLWEAKPLLEKHEIPATVFISTGYVKTGREYWWDELDRLILQPGELPPELQLNVAGKSFDWKLANNSNYTDADFSAHKTWDVSHAAEPTARQSLYRSLINFLYPLPAAERVAALDKLQEWVGNSAGTRESHRALTENEIVELAAGGLVEVGAHTVTHSVLANLPAAEQRYEIQQSKTDLENVLGRPVESFAYPFGTLSDYNDTTVQLVKELGFKYACSNFKDMVQPGADLFQLPRQIVRNWDGEQFTRNLEAWFRN